MTYPAPAAPRRNRTAWIVAGVAAGAVVLAVVLIVAVVLLAGTGPTHAYRDDLCERVDVSPVDDLIPVTEFDQEGGRHGDLGSTRCNFDLDTPEGVSTLRLTLDLYGSSPEAKERYQESLEFTETSDLVPHDPFDTVEEASGPWQQGMLYVGDVFRSADYNVRLKVQDENVTLQVDLILHTPEAPTTYGADEELPRAVQQVAGNTLDALG